MSQARQAFTPRSCALAREIIGWTVSDLAKRSGITVRTVQNLESGKRSPHHGTVTACLRAFLEAGVTFGFDSEGATPVLISSRAPGDRAPGEAARETAHRVEGSATAAPKTANAA